MTRVATKGFGSALRTAWRPIVTAFDDAFDFITAGEDEAVAPQPQSIPADAIQNMRLAAAHLNAVAETVIQRVQPGEPPAAPPTARQVIDDATDEAARFDA